MAPGQGAPTTDGSQASTEIGGRRPAMGAGAAPSTSETHGKPKQQLLLAYLNLADGQKRCSCTWLTAVGLLQVPLHVNHYGLCNGLSPDQPAVL